MIRKLGATLLLGAVVLTAACGGGHGGSSVTPPAGTAGSFSNFEWGKEQLRGAAYVGAATDDLLHVNVMVRTRNADALMQYAQDASNPASPLYRHFLTPQQIGDMFGATDDDYRAAAEYFMAQGLKVAGWPQHLMLAVTGPRTAMERAFGTKFATYSKNGVRFTAPSGTPHLSRAVPITGVGNLVAYHTLKRHFILPPRANAGFDSGYSPQQIRKAFDFSGAAATSVGGHVLDGTGVTVGIIGTGPIDVNRSTWCGDADLNSLKALYGVTAANVCQVNVTASGVASGLAKSGIPTAPPATPDPNNYPPGNTNMFPYSNSYTTPPPVTSPNAPGCQNDAPLSSYSSPRSPNCNPEDAEAQLDTQQVATLAPGSSVQFYLAYNSNDCAVFFPNQCQAAPPTPTPPTPTPSGSPTPTPKNLGYPGEGLVEADAEIQEAIALNQADVVSISFGGGETDSVGVWIDSSGHGFGSLELAALAAEGVAVFVSSGDAGVTECSGAVACVSYPSGDVNVTSVGGVNAPLDETGNLVGNITAWGNTNGGNGSNTAANWGGSGGGVSTIFSAPSWQQSALGVTHREQPDVSMLADPNTAVALVYNANFGGGLTGIGGTSVAAPEMAAMWAIVLQACKATPSCMAGGTYRLGNAAPYLYSILKGSNLVPGAQHGVAAGFPFLSYPHVFYDVVYGENAMLTSAGTYVSGYKAVPGFDLATGMGVPFAGHLVQAVTGQSVP